MEIRNLITFDFADVVDSAERSLVAAVLLRSVLDYVVAPVNSERMKASDDARSWLLYDHVEPFSFVWCCEMLDLDAQVLRAKIFEERKGNIKDGRIRRYAKASYRIKEK